MASVLVVDDEPDIGLLVEAVLVRAGHQVRVALDRSTALALARAEAPDVVIVDLDIDGDDGLEVLARITECAPAVRAALMSGHRRPAHTPSDVRSLAKPFRLGALLDVVDDLVASGPPSGGP